MMDSMNMPRQTMKMELIWARLTLRQEMRMELEDKNILSGFMKDSIMGQVRADG